jgi:sorbitol-6-phosphate 2-dehydrogenase
MKELLPRLRGLSWNGQRSLTYRIISSTESGTNGTEPLALSDDPEVALQEYIAHLQQHDRHPSFCTWLKSTIAVGRNGDTLGTPVAVSDWLDPETRRDTVIKDKVVLITGGAQGFGLALATGMAAAEAQVILADRNIAGASREADLLNRRFQREVASAVAVDVTDEASVAQMVQEIVSRYGGMDVVISNAGVLRAGSVQELSLADFRLVTDVNYTGFFIVAKHTAPILVQQSQSARTHNRPPWYGDIIEINSKSGLAGSNKNGAYAGSKFGGIGLVQSFALELVAHNIKVNAICPGNFLDGPLWSDPETGLFVQYLKAGKVPGATSIAEVRAYYESRVPMGRGCSGEDVLKALLYVIEQTYETGQAVPVTGGQEMLR